MMKKPTSMQLTAVAALSVLALNASAAVTIYETDTMSFSTDGLINVFYTNSDIEKADAAGVKMSRDQSRVRMGFLPNNIGFNFSKQADDLKLGMRSSFWVSINDTDQSRDATSSDLGTGSLIDVRQFYGTVSGSWGEILIGKDFGLYNRENIMSDQLLLGFGQTSDFFGLVDGGNVSFGNISTGYTYAFPKSQITYRTPKSDSGFKFAIGLMDPNKTSSDSSEDRPRIEAELVYSTNINDNFSVKGWVSGVSQTTETAGVTQNQSGLGYGLNLGFSGASLTASGFQSEGLGHVAGLDHIVTNDTVESDGYLVQGAYELGGNRVVLTVGESTVEKTGSILDATHKNTGVAYFRTITPGLTVVFEYNKTEADVTSSLVAEENNTIAIGAVITF